MGSQWEQEHIVCAKNMVRVSKNTVIVTIWGGVADISRYQDGPILNSISQPCNFPPCESHLLQLFDQDKTKESCMHIVMCCEFFNDFWAQVIHCTECIKFHVRSCPAARGKQGCRELNMGS